MTRTAGSAADPVTVSDRVVEVLGREALREAAAAPVANPKSEVETAEILRVAAEREWRVHPAGAALGPETGEGADLILSSLRMNGLIDHAPGNLTVRVRSGSTLGLLGGALAEAGQWLPLDPPGGPAVSVGGVVSTGLPGPLSAAFGRPRDQLLGMTVVDGKGRVLALGGKVVKNVAGFDLVRLAAGSGGALGVVTEATFRLHPLPELDRALVWTFDDPVEAWSLGRKLATLPVPVAAAELIGGDWPAPVPKGGACVLIRLLGSGGAVGQVATEMASLAGAYDREYSGPSAGSVCSALSTADGEPGPRFRAHALPSAGAELLRLVNELSPRRWALHLLGGTFRGLLSEAGLPRLTEVGTRIRAGGGGFRTWGTPTLEPADRVEPRVASLTSGILKEFDPSGILPGGWRA